MDIRVIFCCCCCFFLVLFLLVFFSNKLVLDVIGFNTGIYGGVCDVMGF